ncbi:MAG: hypothetical protein ABSG68_04020 [Thermoguttaceae bacterium]|jgi:hypothetical protein
MTCSIAPPQKPIPRFAAELARWLGWTFAALLPPAALLLAWRRLSGALAEPLSPAAMSCGAVLLAAAALAAHAATQRLAGKALVSLSVVTCGLALSLSGTSTVALLAFWPVLLIEETVSWRPAAGRRRIMRRGNSDADSRSPSPSERGPGRGDITQKLTLRQAADGTQKLSGWLRMPLAPGQRTGSIHVAFCPPFPQTPELRLEQIDGPKARITIAQLLACGVRLDVKLRSTARAPDSVLLRFSARTRAE